MISDRIIYYLVLTMVLVLEVTVFFNAIEFTVPRMLSFIPLVLLLAISFIKGIGINIKIIVAFIFLCILIIIQGILFGISVITLITYPLFVLVVPYLLYRIIEDKIFLYLVNIILVTGLISTGIWLLQIISPSVDAYLQYLRMSPDSFFVRGSEDNSRVSLAFIYTISHWDASGIGIYRNPGLYHEPGAFAYFLIIALGLNTVIQQSFYNRKNMMLTVMLLTTFSTAGYIALLVILSFIIINSNIHYSIKLIVIPLFLAVTLFSFTQLDFMADKIIDQYETQLTDDTVFENRDGRVRRIRSAIYLLSTSPLIGRGIITASRDFELGSIYYFSGAGAWRTLASFGIIFGPIIFFLFYRGIRNLCLQYDYDKRFTFFFFLAILIGATSQRFFTDDITMLLFIYGLMNTINTENIHTINNSSH